MREYWRRPAETAHTLRGGWLHTGDIGQLDAEGLLTVLDRRDDLIVSGGENIYPGEIESVLLEHPAVLEAAVVATPDPGGDLGHRPLAWVVARDVNAAREEEVLAHCRTRLARYKVPIAVRVTDALPRNATGKLLRRALRSPTES